METEKRKPLSLCDAAEAILGYRASTGEDFEKAGLPMIGGCEVCGACVAAYNAGPSRTGSIRCLAGCIDGVEFWTVEEWAVYELVSSERTDAAIERVGAIGDEDVSEYLGDKALDDLRILRGALLLTRAALKATKARADRFDTAMGRAAKFIELLRSGRELALPEHSVDAAEQAGQEDVG